MKSAKAMRVTQVRYLDIDGRLVLVLILGDPYASETVLISHEQLCELMNALSYDWNDKTTPEENLDKRVLLVESERGCIVRIGDPFGDKTANVTDWNNWRFTH